MGRFGLLGVMALMLFLAAAGTASACNLPTIGVSQKPVYPGDPVSYNITDLTSGAKYTIKVGNDVVVQDLTKADGAVSDSFPMPDAGPSSHPISVEVIVDHADIENPEQEWDRPAASPIQYAGHRPVPVLATPEVAQGPVSSNLQSQSVDAAPQPASPGASAPPSGPSLSGGHSPRTPRSPSGAPGPGRSSPIREHGPTHRAHTPASTSHGASAAVPRRSVPLTTAVGAHRSSAESPAGVAAGSHVAEPARARPPAAVPLTRTDRPLPSPHVRANAPPARLASGRSQGSSTRAFALLIGMLLAGGVLAYYLRRRRPGEPVTENWAARYPPPPPMPAEQPIDADRDLAMEAELYELIAEERARELSAEAVSHAASSD